MFHKAHDKIILRKQLLVRITRDQKGSLTMV